jgi:cell division protein FtsX
VSHRVVGVVDTIELAGATAEQRRQVYAPLSSDAPDRLVLSMRTKGSQIGPEQLQHALSEHLPGIPFEDVVSIKTELLKDSRALQVAAQLTLIGAAFSTAITLVAVYCVARVEFQSRLRDIGIMVAIGADVRHVGLLIGRPFQRALMVGLLGGGALCALAVVMLGDLLQLRSVDLLSMLGASALFLSLVLGAAVALPLVRLRQSSPALLLRNP